MLYEAGIGKGIALQDNAVWRPKNFFIVTIDDSYV